MIRSLFKFVREAVYREGTGRPGVTRPMPGPGSVWTSHHLMRDAATREGAERLRPAATSRSFAPAGGGVLPPVPPAGRGSARQIHVEPSLSARVTPCGYPGCACAGGTSAFDVDGPRRSSLQPVDIAPAPQSTLRTPTVLQVAVRDEPTSVGLGRGTT